MKEKICSVPFMYPGYIKVCTDTHTPSCTYIIIHNRRQQHQQITSKLSSKYEKDTKWLKTLHTQLRKRIIEQSNHNHHGDESQPHSLYFHVANAFAHSKIEKEREKTSSLITFKVMCQKRAFDIYDYCRFSPFILVRGVCGRKFVSFICCYMCVYRFGPQSLKAI